MSPRFNKSPKIGGYRGLIESVSAISIKVLDQTMMPICYADQSNYVSLTGHNPPLFFIALIGI